MSNPIRVVAAAWFRGDRLLAARRDPGRARGDLWELPGGKVEPGESDGEALARELSEELGVRVEVHEALADVVHDYGDVHIHLIALRCAGEERPEAAEHAELRWVTAAEAPALRWAPADARLLPPVLARLRSP